MRNQTPRQMRLFLSAKLYELAAEFTDSELNSILQDYSSQLTTPGIREAIRALMLLHRESADTTGSKEGIETLQRVHAQADTPVQQASSLSMLLHDRAVFPNISEIADAVDFPARPKEARDRYIARVTKHVESLTPLERTAFIDTLRSRLKRQPENFISKWSRLIKEL